MKKLTFLLWCMLLSTPMMLVSCGGDEEEEIFDNGGQNGNNNGGQNSGNTTGGDSKPQSKEPIVVGDAKDIKFNTAKIPVTLNVPKGKTYNCSVYFWEDKDGFTPDWSKLNNQKDQEILVYGNWISDGTGTGKSASYEAETFGTKESTTYCYAGMLILEGDTILTPVKKYTSAQLQVETGKAVDLGLSVKWAGYNVGGEKPEDGGDFFAWGETKIKYSYTEAEYTMAKKYNSEDKLQTLLPEDDAATVNWGAEYRMPTCAEKHELLRNTDRITVEYHGVKGILFTSKVNGKSIFFPYTGARVYGSVQMADELIGIWTSTLHSSETSAYIMCNIIANSGILKYAGFDMDGISDSFNLSQYRYMGNKVRAVSK